MLLISLIIWIISAILFSMIVIQFLAYKRYKKISFLIEKNKARLSKEEFEKYYEHMDKKRTKLFSILYAEKNFIRFGIGLIVLDICLVILLVVLGLSSVIKTDKLIANLSNREYVNSTLYNRYVMEAKEIIHFDEGHRFLTLQSRKDIEKLKELTK